MTMLDPIPFAVVSLSVYLSLIWLVVAVKERTGLRRRVYLWIAVRLHLLRDAIGELEARFDDKVIEA